MGGFFPLCFGLFPVIHIWAFVPRHSSMFRVVDVLYTVTYTVAEDEWIFSSLLWIFSCVMVYTVQYSSLTSASGQMRLIEM